MNKGYIHIELKVQQAEKLKSREIKRCGWWRGNVLKLVGGMGVWMVVRWND